MSRIPEQFVDELLSRVDVVEVIDARVKLKKTGKNYSACCPFHKEKTPSFSVSPDKQFYYCFGCGASGTAIGFMMEYEKLSFPEAIESLAGQAGLVVPREDGPRKVKSNKNLYTLLDKCQAFYCEQLKRHPGRDEAVKYLQNRGLTGQVAKDFAVGFAPPGWDNLLTKLGMGDEDRKLLLQAGMLSESEDGKKCYDRFRHRIMFPIIDVRGRTIGFGGRVLSSDSAPLRPDGKKRAGGPKYLNSPETPVFHKSRELYGLYQALQVRGKLDHLLVVEGYMDVIALAQFGIQNAVATMGTACGEEHLKLAFRYTNQVIFCFDGDAAGRKAAKRALENALPAMLDGRQIRFLFLPEGQDPDTLVRQVGAERFSEQLAEAVPLEQFFFESVGEGKDMRTMEGRAGVSKLAAPLLKTLPNGVFRELMFDSLAKRTGLSIDVLQELMAGEASLTESPSALQNSAPQKPVPQEPPPRQQAPAERVPESSFERNPYDESGGAVDESYSQEYLAGFGSATQASFQEGGATPLKSGSSLSPAKLAITLLLEEPDLIGRQPVDVDLPVDEQDGDLVRLHRLLDYLKARPGVNFHSILGYWAGRYGVNDQRELAGLVANQFLGSARKTSRYDSHGELAGAFERIRKARLLRQYDQELSALVALPELDDDQKRRYLELLKLKQGAKSVAAPSALH